MRWEISTVKYLNKLNFCCFNMFLSEALRISRYYIYIYRCEENSSRRRQFSVSKTLTFEMWHQILFGLILVLLLQNQPMTTAEGKVLENCSEEIESNSWFFLSYCCCCVNWGFFQECGESNLRPQRIVNGEDVTPHQYPWMAAMFFTHLTFASCAGAVISTRNIITAGKLNSNYADW